VQWPRRALAAVVVAAGLAFAIPAAPALAQAPEQIRDYAVDLRVEAGGTLLVTEQIAYDFGGEERHGILRDLPVRFLYDDRYDRVYPVHVLGVSASPGTPDQYKLEDVDATLRIRVGDPDRTITGRHDYTIVYQVAGALNGFADHDELYWNAIGTQWEVPIERASVKVSAPAAISRVACYAGPLGATTPCASGAADGRTASFAVTGLYPNEGVTVVVGFPAGAVPTPRPILDERWTMARAFSATPGTLAVAGGVLLVVLLVLGWLFGMAGRDRRPGGASAPVAGAVVESAPPEGIRPAQAGLLVDEVVNPVAITATLVDLAVRGYLRIEDPAVRAEWMTPDWRLVKLKAADKDLLEYERMLLDGLFASRRLAQDLEVVRLADLKQRFYDRFEYIRTSLYRDAVQRRWFTEQPDKVRGRWIVGGIAVTATGAALTVLAAWRTHFGLVAIPVLLAGPVLMAGARRMPARTSVGAGLLRRVRGFRPISRRPGATAPALPRPRISSPPTCRMPSCSASPSSGPGPSRWSARRPSLPGTGAAGPGHRTGSPTAWVASRRPRRRPSAHRRRRRCRDRAALAGAAAPRVAGAAAPRAAGAAEAAATPGKSRCSAGPWCGSWCASALRPDCDDPAEHEGVHPRAAGRRPGVLGRRGRLRAGRQAQHSGQGCVGFAVIRTVVDS
jgi:Predicted membrane protein (DUF2207) N-terminal domain/Predicted membrane protein (DUF2207) C-terminal domain